MTAVLLLRKGDCFNADAAHPGQAAKRACGGPHDAELVNVAELEGDYATGGALKDAASALRRPTLERNAAGQPADTARGSLLRYPATAGH